MGGENKALAAFNRAAQALVGLFGFNRAVVLTFGLLCLHSGCSDHPLSPRARGKGTPGRIGTARWGVGDADGKEKNTTLGLGGFEYCRLYC